MVKKLEQKPKGEGIPTTAKASTAHGLSRGGTGRASTRQRHLPPPHEGAVSGYRGILGAERHTCPDLGPRLQSPRFPPQAGVPTI